MSEERPYSITTTGVVLDGFDLEQTVSGFASLFGVAPEKAAAYLDRRRLIRKDLSREEAEDYRARLTAIGVDVELYGRPVARSRDAPATDTDVPLTPAEAEARAVGDADGHGADPSRQAAMAADAPAIIAQDARDKTTRDWTAILIPPVIVAIALAFVWRFIALALGDEPGFFGWFVGAVIGLVAAAAGGRGKAVGFVCATLTLLAVLGGKGLVLTSDPTESFGLLVGETDTKALRTRMDEYAADARAFKAIGRDDDSIRQFMVRHAYSEAAAGRWVTAAEVDAFRTTTQPWLEDYRPWMEQAERRDAASLASGLVTSFDGVGVLFLIVGTATAFRLGALGRKTPHPTSTGAEGNSATET